MTNREAVNATVAALRQENRLKDADSAVVQMVESLADAVDFEPGNASLWREFRAALETLRHLGLEDQNDGDEISLIIAALRGDAPVRNTANTGKAKPRSGGRKAGSAAR